MHRLTDALADKQTDSDADWLETAPVEQIPALVSRLVSLQLLLVARWLDQPHRRSSAEETSRSEQLLSMKQVARILDVPVGYARELGRRDDLPVVHVGPKYVRVRRSALDAWIAQREDRDLGAGAG